MASITEILTKEELNEPQTHLYKEGIFWKAYQQSAYRVILRQPGFKLKKRYIKVASSEVISVGFPEESLERIFRKEDIKPVNEKCISVSGEAIDTEAYTKWFNAVPLSELPVDTAQPRPAVAPVSAPGGSKEAVLRRIKEFPIEQSTPIECMLFLTQIRKELIGYGNI